jgi:hypothetical protein
MAVSESTVIRDAPARSSSSECCSAGKPIAGCGPRLRVARAVPRPHSQTELRGSRHGPERLVDGRKVLVALTEFDRPAQTFVQHSRK